MWGHYTSENMIDWEYQGVMLYPDQPFDLQRSLLRMAHLLKTERCICIIQEM